MAQVLAGQGGAAFPAPSSSGDSAGATARARRKLTLVQVRALAARLELAQPLRIDARSGRRIARDGPHHLRHVPGRPPARPGLPVQHQPLGDLPLHHLEPFREFSAEEIRTILAVATRCDLPAKRLLFREGEPGDSCFILVRGQVDVTIKLRHQRHLIAQLTPGTMFGQVSLIAGTPRSTTCTIGRDAVLAQLDRAACERLLGTRSRLALKFLAAINLGLTEALRVANRRLMQIEGGDRRAAWQPSATATP